MNAFSCDTVSNRFSTLRHFLFGLMPSGGPIRALNDSDSERVRRDAYLEAVRARIVSLHAAGTRSLFDACRKAGGAFPVLIRDLAEEEGIPLSLARPSNWTDDEGPGELAGLTEPHPLDFEWRFANETADYLAERLVENAGVGGTIGCFGTPTVYSKLLRAGHWAILFDKNPSFQSLSTLTQQTAVRHPETRVQTTDLSYSHVDRAVPPLDIALLDPPWYVDHTLAWLQRVLANLKPDGMVILSIFPELLRPAAEPERIQLFDAMHAIGGVTRLDRDAVYTTPVFERETLAAHGIPDLGAWRSGELYAIRVTGRASLTSPAVTPEPVWNRIQFGTQVVALRETPSEDGPLEVHSATDDGSFLVKSVSSRDPVRDRINLFTSRNRAALVSDPVRVLVFLNRIRDGMSAQGAIGLADLADRPALQTVQALIGL